MIKEKVSIIVPIYNVEDYIDECIESIVNQKYTNLQIILVDDGSTDSSGEKADEWGKKDSRIVVVHKDNAGLSAARNDGLRMADGEFIMFVDSDDYIKQDMVEKLYDAIVSENTEISICYENSFEDGKDPVEKQNPITEMVIEDHNQFRLHCLDNFRGPFSWAWNKMYRASVVAGESFVEGRVLEDIMFMVKILPKINKVVWIPHRLYYYRQRSTSVMHSNFVKRNTDYLYALNYEYNMITNNEKDGKFVAEHGVKVLACIHQIYQEAKQLHYKEIVKMSNEYYISIFKDIDWHNASLLQSIRCRIIKIRMKLKI